MDVPEKATREQLRKSALLKVLRLPPAERRRWEELETRWRALLAAERARGVLFDERYVALDERPSCSSMLARLLLVSSRNQDHSSGTESEADGVAAKPPAE
jgi:hypothetical protein